MKKTKFYTGHRWSNDELKTLMELWANKEPNESIAETLKITVPAMLKMVGRLRRNGIPLERRTRGHVANRTNKLWTQGEVEFLLRRRSEKATIDDIAVELGRTWCAVNGMIARLRQESVPVAMFGNGVRKLWDADSLKCVAEQIGNRKVIELDSLNKEVAIL